MSQTTVLVIEAIRAVGKDRITEDVLAELVGFQDINYFYKQFKLTMGCTPKEYRLH